MSRASTPTSSELCDGLDSLSVTGNRSPGPASSHTSSLLRRSWQHGNDVVHVVVGSETNRQTFTFHRDLLARASFYFERALCSQAFVLTASVNLPNDSPSSFKVIYQYLYVNKLRNDSFYDMDCPSDAFWLRAFKTSDYLSLHGLATRIYRKFVSDIFGPGPDFCPSELFIHELFLPTHLAGALQLQNFIVSQAAYTVFQNYESAWSSVTWNSIFALEPDFSLKVLQQISRLRANEPGLWKGPAAENPKYAAYREEPSRRQGGRRKERVRR